MIISYRLSNLAVNNKYYEKDITNNNRWAYF
ncbi:hypothetical protein MCERE19_03514 [Spirosomataceae bacterium]|jgi:hypothetical protein